ncbi:MAG: CopG family transcriptional regulator [Actinobacteria bacterium]|nr:CopG family transcriptional regulator [Actinomycetota bacterium]
MTTVRLNNEILNKIAALTKIEKTTKSEIIKKAIIEYYDMRSKDLMPFELGMDLFGRYGNSKYSSVNYKIKLKEKLHEKHSH